jgi:hypothetical protein
MKRPNFHVDSYRVLFTVISLATLLWATGAAAVDRVNKDTFGVAIKGYDPVAYFTEGRAVKGKNEYSHSWNEATWHFKSAGNRDLFADDPERYAPQFGGY